jgi:hypothetical protein
MTGSHDPLWPDSADSHHTEAGIDGLPDPNRPPYPGQRFPEERFPWPPRAGSSPLVALIETWKLSVFQPTLFFQQLPVPHSIGSAVLYYLIVGIPAVGITLFWQMLFRLLYSSAGFEPASAAAPESAAWMPIVQFLLSPLFLLVGLGISFVVTHLLLMIFRGANRGAGTTLRVLCYSYGPALFVIVPVVGALVGGVWTIVLAIIGLREAHQTDGWRAATAILLPIVAAFFLVVALFIVVGALGLYLAS